MYRLTEAEEKRTKYMTETEISMMIKERQAFINKFKGCYIEFLGCGAEGNVFRCRDKDGRVFSVKSYYKITDEKNSGAIRENLEKQQKMIQNTKKTLKIKLVGSNIINNKCVPYVYFKNMDGDLRDIELGDCYNKFMVGFKLAIALCSLHDENIAHGDVKPENTLVEKESNKIKLTDFGHSVQSSDDTQHPIGGTKGYRAPELEEKKWMKLKVECKDLLQGDIYALGVTIFEIITGDTKFVDMDRDNKLRQLEKMKHYKGNILPNDTKNKRIRTDFIELIEAMIDDDPSKRPTAKEVLNRLTRLYVSISEEENKKMFSFKKKLDLSKGEGTFITQNLFSSIQEKITPNSSENFKNHSSLLIGKTFDVGNTDYDGLHLDVLEEEESKNYNDIAKNVDTLNSLMMLHHKRQEQPCFNEVFSSKLHNTMELLDTNKAQAEPSVS